MKRDNPFFDTMRWVLVGGVIGLLLYLGHLIFLHQEQSEVDDHSSYSSTAGRL